MPQRVPDDERAKHRATFAKQYAAGASIQEIALKAHLSTGYVQARLKEAETAGKVTIRRGLSAGERARLRETVRARRAAGHLWQDICRELGWSETFLRKLLQEDRGGDA